MKFASDNITLENSLSHSHSVRGSSTQCHTGDPFQFTVF